MSAPRSAARPRPDEAPASGHGLDEGAYRYLELMKLCLTRYPFLEEEVRDIRRWGR